MLILVLSFCMNVLYTCIRSFESDATACVSRPSDQPKPTPTDSKETSKEKVSVDDDKSSTHSRNKNNCFSNSCFYKKQKESSESKTVKRTSIVKTKYESDEPLQPNDSDIQAKEIIITDEILESIRTGPVSDASIKSPRYTSTPAKLNRTKSTQSSKGSGSKRKGKNSG